MKRERLKSNINVEEDIISYNVMFNKERTSVTPEHVLSVIIEYCYYLASKTMENGYDDMKEVAKVCNDTNSIIMTVSIHQTLHTRFQAISTMHISAVSN